MFVTGLLHSTFLIVLYIIDITVDVITRAANE